jgi:hypothetical protein
LVCSIENAIDRSAQTEAAPAWKTEEMQNTIAVTTASECLAPAQRAVEERADAALSGVPL